MIDVIKNWFHCLHINQLGRVPAIIKETRTNTVSLVRVQTICRLCCRCSVYYPRWSNILALRTGCKWITGRRSFAVFCFFFRKSCFWPATVSTTTWFWRRACSQSGYLALYQDRLKHKEQHQHDQCISGRFHHFKYKDQFIVLQDRCCHSSFLTKKAEPDYRPVLYTQALSKSLLRLFSAAFFR